MSCGLDEDELAAVEREALELAEKGGCASGACGAACISNAGKSHTCGSSVKSCAALGAQDGAGAPRQCMKCKVPTGPGMVHAMPHVIINMDLCCVDEELLACFCALKFCVYCMCSLFMSHTALRYDACLAQAMVRQRDALCQECLYDMLLLSVRRAVRATGMIAPGDRVLVAVSGGPAATLPVAGVMVCFRAL